MFKVNFEHTPHLVLVFLLLTLSRYIGHVGQLNKWNMCKMMTSPNAFFDFEKVLIFQLLGGRG